MEFVILKDIRLGCTLFNIFINDQGKESDYWRCEIYKW